MISTTCAQLIERGAAYGPLYANGLSNHLPMALIALDRMGASPSRLEAFFAGYAPRLTPRAQLEPPVDPTGSLGVERNFEGVLTYFRALLAEQGRERVLRTWLPMLLPGVAADAFHSMIRLAYAVDACEESEMACRTPGYASGLAAVSGSGRAIRR